jgi:hypothetical protein
MHAVRFARRIAVLLLVIATASARADDLPERWRPLDIGLLPLVDMALLDGAPFGAPAHAAGSPFDATQRISARRRATIQRWLAGRLGTLDLVTVHTDEQLRQRIQRDTVLQGHLAVGGERFDLGRERWLSLEALEAIGHFDRARDLYLQAFADILVPERFAELEFHRGLVLSELERWPEALAAFRAMFLFDPSRRFTPGWYGPSVDALLTTAATDARAVREPTTERFPVERLALLGQAAGVRQWAIGVIIAGPDDTYLDLDIVSFERAPAIARRSARFALVAPVPPFVEPSPFRVPDLVDRWLTAWHVCAIEREATPFGWRPDTRRTLFVDLSYRHEVWLTHRQTRLFLHGPGFHVGLQWEPDPMFQVWARLGQVTTLIDARGDLLNEFATTHVAAGGALRLGSESVSLTVRAGLTAALSLNDFEATNDIDCKFFGATHPRCGTVFRANAPLAWFGFDAGLQLRVQPHRSWYLTFGVGTSVYLVSPEAARELNHPLSVALGVGAAF